MRNLYPKQRTLLMAAAIAMIPLTPSFGQTSPEIYAILDAGHFALTLKIVVKPEDVDRFVSLMKSRIEQSRQAPEVVDFRIMATGKPNVFAGYESFRSKAAFEAFAATPESQAFLEAVKQFTSEPIAAEVLHPLP